MCAHVPVSGGIRNGTERNRTGGSDNIQPKLKVKVRYQLRVEAIIFTRNQTKLTKGKKKEKKIEHFAQLLYSNQMGGSKRVGHGKQSNLIWESGAAQRQCYTTVHADTQQNL